MSSTFHGRDVFAPAAAHLAAASRSTRSGPAIDPASLVALAAAGRRARSTAGSMTEIVYVDTFGNVKLSALVDGRRAPRSGEPVGAGSG